MNRHDLHSIDIAFDTPADEITFFVCVNQRHEDLKNASRRTWFSFAGHMQNFHHMSEVGGVALAR